MSSERILQVVTDLKVLFLLCSKRQWHFVSFNTQCCVMVWTNCHCSHTYLYSRCTQGFGVEIQGCLLNTRSIPVEPAADSQHRAELVGWAGRGVSASRQTRFCYSSRVRNMLMDKKKLQPLSHTQLSVISRTKSNWLTSTKQHKRDRTQRAHSKQPPDFGWGRHSTENLGLMRKYKNFTKFRDACPQNTGSASAKLWCGLIPQSTIQVMAEIRAMRQVQLWLVLELLQGQLSNSSPVHKLAVKSCLSAPSVPDAALCSPRKLIAKVAIPFSVSLHMCPALFVCSSPCVHPSFMCPSQDIFPGHTVQSQAMRQLSQ